MHLTSPSLAAAPSPKVIEHESTYEDVTWRARATAYADRVEYVIRFIEDGTESGQVQATGVLLSDGSTHIEVTATDVNSNQTSEGSLLVGPTEERDHPCDDTAPCAVVGSTTAGAAAYLCTYSPHPILRGYCAAGTVAASLVAFLFCKAAGDCDPPLCDITAGIFILSDTRVRSTADVACNGQMEQIDIHLQMWFQGYEGSPPRLLWSGGGSPCFSQDECHIQVDAVTQPPFKNDEGCYWTYANSQYQWLNPATNELHTYLIEDQSLPKCYGDDNNIAPPAELDDLARTFKEIVRDSLDDFCLCGVQEFIEGVLDDVCVCADDVIDQIREEIEKLEIEDPPSPVTVVGPLVDFVFMTFSETYDDLCEEISCKF